MLSHSSRLNGEVGGRAEVGEAFPAPNCRSAAAIGLVWPVSPDATRRPGKHLGDDEAAGL